MEKRLTSEIKQFIRDHLHENPTTLLLKKTVLSPEDLKTAVHQIFCRKKYKYKLPEWCDNEDILFPPTLSMEQCSSEYTAKRKASIIGSGNTFIDLTGGFGVDTFYISHHFKNATHIERNQELSTLVSKNFYLLNKDIQCVHSDGMSFLQKEKTIYDALLVDPARRHDIKGKVYLLEDCEPNIIEIQDQLLSKAGTVYVKLSPMLDIHSVKVKLKNITDLYVIAYRNEVKELFCKMAPNNEKELTTHAINIQHDGQYSEDFSTKEQKEAIIANKLEEYIYEPNKAILKAGIQDTLSCTFQLNKLHPFSHIYTSSKLHLSFPGRVLSLIDHAKAQAKAIKTLVPEQKANVLIRNFPGSANALASKLKLKDGGTKYIIGTTLWTNEKRLLICERVK